MASPWSLPYEQRKAPARSAIDLDYGLKPQGNRIMVCHKMI